MGLAGRREVGVGCGTGVERGCTCSKHGFYSGACRLLGIWGGGFERPCLAGVLFYIDRGGTWPKTHNGWVAGQISMVFGYGWMDFQGISGRQNGNHAYQVCCCVVW